MVTEFSEDALPRNPELDLLHCTFTLSRADATEEERAEAKARIDAEILQNNMAPFYEAVCARFGWTRDDAFMEKLREANKAKLAEIEATLAEAKEKAGESEVREALLAKADYLCQIGEKEAAETAYRVTMEKTMAVGQKIDITFSLIRMGFFHRDNNLITRNIDKAKTLIDEGGDWDRRNRLKVYEGLYALSVRNFKLAATLLLESLSTFTSYEIMSFTKFVNYAILAAIISLNRVELKKKVLHAPEITEVLHESETFRSYLHSLYKCNYAEFFRALADIEVYLNHDIFLCEHSRFYVREVRILAYSQLLESYRSVTVDSIATSFGVSHEFIDRELSRFIAAGRLNCKIDKVNSVVETNRPDHKNSQYQDAIKMGDELLNRVQKLSRVINI